MKREWVEQTVRKPHWIEPEPRDKSAERRFATIHEFGSRVLRVVCAETEDAIRVITVLFDREHDAEKWEPVFGLHHAPSCLRICATPSDSTLLQNARRSDR